MKSRRLLMRTCPRMSVGYAEVSSAYRTTLLGIPSLGQHREGGSILLGSIGSTPGIELLSPIPALAPVGGAGSDR